MSPEDQPASGGAERPGSPSPRERPCGGGGRPVRPVAARLRRAANTVRREVAARLAEVARHPRHVVLLAFAAGLVLGPLGTPALLAGVLVASGLAGPRPLAIAAVVAILGGAQLADARLAALGPGGLPALIGERIVARAVLLEPLRLRRDGSSAGRVRLLEATGGGPSGAAGRAGRAVASLRGEIAVVRAADGRPTPGLRVGGELELRGAVAPLGPVDAFQRRRGAHAAVEVTRWRHTGRGRGGVPGALDAIRERASQGLGTGLSAPEAALLRGMVLGQDEAVAEDTREAFRRSGLAHLLAVSGQNVLLLCTLVLAFGALTGMPLSARLGLAAVLVVLYVPLAGGGPSIQRAGVMGVAGLVAALAGRPASRWYALGLAAAVTLALNPLAAGEPGWQLSFAAVIGLLVLAPSLRAGFVRLRIPELVADVVAITTAATLATAPLLALHFEQVSLVSLPANLLAAPVVAPVMWLGMLAMAAAQVAPVLAGPFTAACAPLLGYLEWVAERAAALPHAAVPVRLGSPAGVIAAYGLLGVLAAVGPWVTRGIARRIRRTGIVAPVAGEPGGRPREEVERAGADRLAWTAARWVRPVLGFAVAAAVVLLGAPVLRGRQPPRLTPGELVVSFLDVGQGDATLLQCGGASVLVDTGPPGAPILRRLERAGVGRLDLLVITHAEADHEGNAREVIARHRPRLVLDGGAGWPTAVQRSLPGAVARTGGRLTPGHAGQVLRVGPLRIEVLWPPAPSPGWRPDGNPNDRAIVAHVQDGDFDLLLPADAESNVTAGLDLPRVEALKVAHHGSTDPGLPALLERMRPQVAAIEVGADNTYGHPTPSTLGALRGVPRLVRTDRDGTVRLRVRGGAMRLESG